MTSTTGGSRSQKQKAFYPAKRFSGSISWNQQRLQCTLSAEIGDDGSLRIDLDDVPINNDTSFLFQALKTGSKFPLFCVDAVSDDDDRLSSKNLYFTNPGDRSDESGSYFTFSGYCSKAKIIINNTDGAATSRITYWVRGFRCFGILHSKTEFGELTMIGSDCDDPMKIAGRLDLETNFDLMSTDRRGDLLAFLEHVMWIMSFACGTLLKSPVRAFANANTTELEIQSASVSAHTMLPPFNYLHLDPIFERTVSSYFDKHTECKDIRVPIELILINPSYRDVGLLTMAIAIELLADRFLKESDKTFIAKTRFRELLHVLKCTIDASELLSNADRDFIMKAVVEGNRLSFRSKIDRLVSKWQISMCDLPPDLVKNLVNVRNTFAHGKILREEKKTRAIDSWELLLAVRDFLTRIILSRIGYVGQYVSYIGGQHTRSFPSCERQY